MPRAETKIRALIQTLTWIGGFPFVVFSLS